MATKAKRMKARTAYAMVDHDGTIVSVGWREPQPVPGGVGTNLFWARDHAEAFGKTLRKPADRIARVRVVEVKPTNRKGS